MPERGEVRVMLRSSGHEVHQDVVVPGEEELSLYGIEVKRGGSLVDDLHFLGESSVKAGFNLLGKTQFNMQIARGVLRGQENAYVDVTKRRLGKKQPVEKGKNNLGFPFQNGLCRFNKLAPFLAFRFMKRDPSHILASNPEYSNVPAVKTNRAA